MTCDVFDHLYFTGMAQPHVGTFTLKLGDIITECKNEAGFLLNNLQSNLDVLQMIIDQREKNENVHVRDIMMSMQN